MPRDTSIPAADPVALAMAGLARRLELTADYLRQGRPALAWGMMEGVAEQVRALVVEETRDAA